MSLDAPKWKIHGFGCNFFVRSITWKYFYFYVKTVNVISKLKHYLWQQKWTFFQNVEQFDRSKPLYLTKQLGKLVSIWNIEYHIFFGTSIWCLLTYFSCTVNIFNIKYGSKSKKQNLGQRCYQLGLGYNNVYAIWSRHGIVQTFHSQRIPTLKYQKSKIIGGNEILYNTKFLTSVWVSRSCRIRNHSSRFVGPRRAPTLFR